MKFNHLYIILLTSVVSTIGCSNKTSLTGVPENPTFSEHIAPILAKNCLPCHRENGAAPFSLERFEAVRKRAKTIAKVTQNRYMPPWPADPNYSHFVGEKVLTEIEIATISRWAEQGAPEGNAAYTYQAPVSYKSNIRKPDLVIPFDTVLYFQSARSLRSQKVCFGFGTDSVFCGVDSSRQWTFALVWRRIKNRGTGNGEENGDNQRHEFEFL